MKLFDKRFVHFMWDDELKGKKCFVRDRIDDLVDVVEKGGPDDPQEVEYSGKPYSPFQIFCDDEHFDYVFAYYDPNYDVKKAFNEGKTIQYQPADELNWRDVEDEDAFERLLEEVRVFRIKPEEDERWIVYLARPNDGGCYLTACTEDFWDASQKDRHAKTKLFIGSESEAQQWYESRQKFAKVIKAWEDGKTIQFLNYGQWEDCRGKPLWCLTNMYHVKPEEKEYRPYKSGKEFIQDFQERFRIKYNPSWSMPSIWVKNKENDARFLIFAFYERFIKFNDDEPFMFRELLDDYTYLDGSPCGMEE